MKLVKLIMLLILLTASASVSATHIDDDIIDQENPRTTDILNFGEVRRQFGMIDNSEIYMSEILVVNPLSLGGRAYIRTLPSPDSGVLTIHGPTQVLTFTPAADFVGDAMFVVGGTVEYIFSDIPYTVKVTAAPMTTDPGTTDPNPGGGGTPDDTAGGTPVTDPPANPDPVTLPVTTNPDPVTTPPATPAQGTNATAMTDDDDGGFDERALNAFAGTAVVLLAINVFANKALPGKLTTYALPLSDEHYAYGLQFTPNDNWDIDLSVIDKSYVDEESSRNDFYQLKIQYRF